MFIGIAGIIGAGKSTLTQNLAKEFDFKAYYEPVEENKYLSDFYEDPDRWAAMMQMHLLSKRFEQHQQIVWNSEGNKVVQDRTIYEDTIFAKMLNEDGIISDREYQTYKDHFDIMRRFLVYPDLILHLNVDPEIALDRIGSRGRDMETGIDLEYLTRLHEGYQEFLDEMSQYTSILEIDWSDFKSASEVHSLIKEAVDENSTQYKRSLRKL